MEIEPKQTTLILAVELIEVEVDRIMYQILHKKGKYKYLWAKCQQDEVINAAWRKLRKGKTKRREVQEIEAHYDYYVGRMKEMLRNTRPGEVENEAMRFHPRQYKSSIIYEHGKEREKVSPRIWEQWVHHIVMQVLAPIITKVSHPMSCGSMPGRGGIYGKRYLDRLIRRKGFKYFTKIDIRHFYNKIQIKFVIDMLRELIEDEWFIYLFARMFMYFQKRIPLGFYPSQWVGNFLLHKLDWKIAKTNPKGYIRYVDDIVICSDNKYYLHELLIKIKKDLGKLRLKLKRNYQVARFDYTTKRGKKIGRGIDFMGFLFKRKNTVLRRSIMMRTTHYANKLSHLPTIAMRQASSMLSRLGWFKHTDTYYIWLTYIKDKVTVKALKKIVSINQRRINNANRVESGVLLSAA